MAARPTPQLSDVLLVCGVVALLGVVGTAAWAFPIGVVLVAAVALFNGANDISKAVATLVGAGILREGVAVAWGSGMTFAGAVIGVAVGAGLTATFSTRLLPAEAVVTSSFALSVLLGAAAWLVIATRAGLPVSTTHALVGALVATAVVTYGPDRVPWWLVLTAVAVPLLLGPAIGLVLAIVLLRFLRFVPRDRGALRHLHWVSSGLTAAARGMNDAPKIAGLGVLVLIGSGQSSASTAGWIIPVVVVVGMTVGGLVAGRRVTDTLARRVTPLDDTDGLASNTATSTLVTAAAFGGLPVSTTHVAGGSVVGVGVSGGSSGMNLRVVREIAMAWLLTAPAAGALAVLARVVVGD